MKDHVFIIWSGTPDNAFQVKRQLELCNYKCTIGGNSDNNSTYASVGDTVIQQMKSCNQAIVIFQNKEDGSVSNNLFFELGYVLSLYGPKKVHCVKKRKEQITLPSDFDNSFVEPLSSETDEAFVADITSYFLNRQKMSITENKMTLINNRYRMHDLIRRHYSEQGSLCSDYELAQYILFYVEAGQLFGDEKAILAELIKFKNDHQTEFSDEMQIAVNMGIAFYEMTTSIKLNEKGNCYIERHVFRRFKDVFMQCLEDMNEDDYGVFDEWARVFISDQLTYAYNLIAYNEELGEETQQKHMLQVKKWAMQTIEDIEKLSSMPHIKENNDRRGLLSLLYAYIYRNLFLYHKSRNEEAEMLDCLKKTKRERTSLKNNYAIGSIDSKLYENFSMEYYLTLCECIQYADKLSLDEDEIEDYKEEIREFINSYKKNDDSTLYISKIKSIIASPSFQDT